MPRNAIAPSSRKVETEEHADRGLHLPRRRSAIRSDAGAGDYRIAQATRCLHHPDTLVTLLVPDALVVASGWPNEAPANLSKDLLSDGLQPHYRDE